MSRYEDGEAKETIVKYYVIINKWLGTEFWNGGYFVWLTDLACWPIYYYNKYNATHTDNNN